MLCASDVVSDVWLVARFMSPDMLYLSPCVNTSRLISRGISRINRRCGTCVAVRARHTRAPTPPKTLLLSVALRSESVLARASFRRNADSPLARPHTRRPPSLTPSVPLALIREGHTLDSLAGLWPLTLAVAPLAVSVDGRLLQVTALCYRSILNS